MIEGKNIIYFGPGKWEGMWRNRHQLMSLFAKKNKVIYVEPQVYLKNIKDELSGGIKGIKRLFQLAKRNRVTHLMDNLYIYHGSIFVPLSGRFPLKKITMWMWSSIFKSTLNKLGFNDVIIWLSFPNMCHYIDKLSEKLLIYHVVDEYLSYSGNSTEGKENLRRLENEIIEKADLVIVVSEELLKSKGKSNEKTYLVQNAVDYDKYDIALSNFRGVPNSINRLNKPIIGYSGLISSRIDLELIHYIASKHPEWSLVLMGDVNHNECEDILNKLYEMENVCFLIRKNIDDLPYYINSFDVCLVPYKINEETKNLSPLKLYEYLACGKPVVATQFPAAMEFDQIIYIAETKEKYESCIGNALVEKNDNVFNLRKRIARQNTWNERAVQLSKIITNKLINKS